MRQGVIRPRQYGSRVDRDDKLAKYDAEKGPNKRVVGAIALLVLICVAWLFWSPVATKTDVNVSLNVAPLENRQQIRGGLEEDDEDDEEQEEGGLLSHDDEDSEESDEEKPASHAASDDEEKEEEEEEEEEEGEEEGEEAEEEEGKAAMSNESVEKAGSDHVIEAFPGHSIEEIKEAKFSSKPTLTIESYFLNLGKKSVNISPSGSFKFVLVHAKDKNGDGAYIVQGCSSKSKTCKHPDAARVVRSSLESHGMAARVLGGGRITRHHLRKSKKAGLISIFGYSRTYGRCEDCNRKTCEVVAQAYPEYVVRWSNQGYHESDEYSIKDFVKCSAP